MKCLIWDFNGWTFLASHLSSYWWPPNQDFSRVQTLFQAIPYPLLLNNILHSRADIPSHRVIYLTNPSDGVNPTTCGLDFGFKWKRKHFPQQLQNVIISLEKKFVTVSVLLCYKLQVTRACYKWIINLNSRKLLLFFNTTNIRILIEQLVPILRKFYFQVTKPRSLEMLWLN